MAVPIAHDQAARIARCRYLGLVREAPLADDAIVEAVAALNADAGQRRALIAAGQSMGIRDGLPRILDWMAALLAAAARP